MSAQARARHHTSRQSQNAFAHLRPSVLAVARMLLLPLTSAAPLSFWEHKRLNTLEEDLPKSPDDPNLWLYLGVAIALVLLGGIFAGLTIALMGQDETYLNVIASSGEGSERKHAKKVLKLLNKGKHWVLVALLLSNVITNETLPIVLDRSLGGGWPAVVSSTVLIVIFGEVAPQSICVRYGLSIGAFCAPFVLVLMWILAPVAWPTAKLLDYLLGKDHGTMYKKAGLKTLVTLHKTLGAGAGEQLMEDEVKIISCVLDLKDKPVGDIMTPMQDVFTMSADTILDERMMDMILSQGYSRIPIYAPENSRNFIGMLLVKILITYDPEDCKRVRDFALATLPETAPYTSCLDIINFFQEGKSHMVLVSDFPGQDRGAIGVVTLEDVIEELIGEEIIDESDVFIDVHKAIRRGAPAPRTRFRNNHFSTDVAAESEDDQKEPTENQPLLKKRDSSVEPRRTSLTNGQTTFLMRRKSSAASGSVHEASRAHFPVRSNTTDLKEHLKHLGPSNAAANPRPTKFSNVKIKPGVSTIPENAAVTKDMGAETSMTKDETPTKDSTGPSGDGVDRQGSTYGTIDPGTPVQHPWRSSNPPGSMPDMTAQEASEAAKANTSRPQTADASNQNGQPPAIDDDAETFKLPEKLVVGEPKEDDEVGELNASGYQKKKRTATRSGSITETTMDINGLTKTVLEMTSSSEEAENEGTSPGTTEGPSGGMGSFFGFGRRKSSASEDSAQGSTSNKKEGAGSQDFGNGNGEGGDTGEGNKKRRKKRGKKKKSSD